MVLNGAMNMHGLGYGFQDTMNFNFSIVLINSSPPKVHFWLIINCINFQYTPADTPN